LLHLKNAKLIFLRPLSLQRVYRKKLKKKGNRGMTTSTNMLIFFDHGSQVL
jgi:hypothetical protein